MTTSMNDDQLLRELVAACERSYSANQIAAGVTGATSRAEMALLARDPEAVLVQRMVREETTRRARIRWCIATVAASVLIGIGVFALLDRGADEPQSPQIRLASAIDELKRAHPDLFADFEPVSADMLDGGSGVVRGGGTWRGPTGTVLEAPGELTWTNPKGTRRMRISLRGPNVTWRKDVAGASVEGPAMAAGRYVVTLQPLDGFARQAVRRTFVVASEEERAAYARAKAEWKKTTAKELHDVLEAHYAYGRDYLDAARSAARRATESGGDAAALVAPLHAHLSRGG